MLIGKICVIIVWKWFKMTHTEYDKLIQPHRENIIKFLQNKVKTSNEVAEDLAQNVFIKAYKNLLKTEVPIEHFKPWLYKIAINEFINWYRRDKNKYFVESELIKSENSDDMFFEKNPDDFSYDEIDFKITFNDIYYDGIELLKNKNLDMYNILMDYVTHENYDIVADLNNIPVGTVKSRVCRARQFLKKYFSDNGLALSEF